jgi:uncharacterized membrane-anchored protein YhcB (DUF1043 family)
MSSKTSSMWLVVILALMVVVISWVVNQNKYTRQIDVLNKEIINLQQEKDSLEKLSNEEKEQFNKTLNLFKSASPSASSIDNKTSTKSGSKK